MFVPDHTFVNGLYIHNDVLRQLSRYADHGPDHLRAIDDYNRTIAQQWLRAVQVNRVMLWVVVASALITYCFTDPSQVSERWWLWVFFFYLIYALNEALKHKLAERPPTLNQT